MLHPDQDKQGRWKPYARNMPSSGERTVAVAHHPTEIQPWQQTPYPGGTINLSRDHGHRLVAKEARARSSVIDAADLTAALARRELVQHGARSVAFAGGRTTTMQSVRRLLRCKQVRGPTQVPEARERQISWQEWKSKGQTRSLRCV